LKAMIFAMFVSRPSRTFAKDSRTCQASAWVHS
jgi:hypothetical protein